MSESLKSRNHRGKLIAILAAVVIGAMVFIGSFTINPTEKTGPHPEATQSETVAPDPAHNGSVIEGDPDTPGAPVDPADFTKPLEVFTADYRESFAGAVFDGKSRRFHFKANTSAATLAKARDLVKDTDYKIIPDAKISLHELDEALKKLNKVLQEQNGKTLTDVDVLQIPGGQGVKVAAGEDLMSPLKTAFEDEVKAGWLELTKK